MDFRRDCDLPAARPFVAGRTAARAVGAVGAGDDDPTSRAVSGALPRDAAAALAAGQRLDVLRLQLAAQLCGSAGWSGLRSHLAGLAQRAPATQDRLCATTTGL